MYYAMYRSFCPKNNYRPSNRVGTIANHYTLCRFSRKRRRRRRRKTKRKRKRRRRKTKRKRKRRRRKTKRKRRRRRKTKRKRCLPINFGHRRGLVTSYPLPFWPRSVLSTVCSFGSVCIPSYLLPCTSEHVEARIVSLT
jgi:hypothetical protein